MATPHHRTEVRRLRLVDIEAVHHHQHGQEWVPHWHAEWSFGAVIDGTCRCSVAGQPFTATRGDLIAIPPGVVHTGALLADAPGAGVSIVMLYVPADWLAQAGLSPPARSVRLAAPALARAARRLDTPEAVQAWLRAALPWLAQAAGPASAASDTALPGPATQALLTRLQAAVVDGEVHVGRLAARCGISRERLHRVVRQWVGLTPTEYLRAVRLLRARQLLAEGLPVATVAADCGFADQAHFTRWFRRSFGYTPGDFLRALRDGA